MLSENIYMISYWLTIQNFDVIDYTINFSIKNCEDVHITY